MTESPWFTKEQLADRLEISPRTLDEWRKKGIGPRSIPISPGGQQLRYHVTEIERWERELLESAK